MRGDSAGGGAEGAGRWQGQEGRRREAGEAARSYQYWLEAGGLGEAQRGREEGVALGKARLEVRPGSTCGVLKMFGQDVTEGEGPLLVGTGSSAGIAFLTFFFGKIH